MNPLKSYQIDFELKQIENRTYNYYTVPTVPIVGLRSPFELYQTTLKSICDYNLNIPLNGLVDNEALFLAAVQSGISFNPIFIRFQDSLNEKEFQDALSICNTYKKNLTVLNINLDDFFSSGQHFQFATDYQCRNPLMAVDLWMMDQVPGAFIFPYRPLPIKREQSGQFYVGFPSSNYSCYDNYFAKNGRAGISCFSICKPEILYSYLKLPIYLNALFDDHFFDVFSPDDISFNYEVYREGGFVLRPKKRQLTAFEKYKLALNRKHLSYEDQMRGVDYYEKNFKIPMQEKVPGPNYKSTGNIDFENLFEIYSANPKT